RREGQERGRRADEGAWGEDVDDVRVDFDAGELAVRSFVEVAAVCERGADQHDAALQWRIGRRRRPGLAERGQGLTRKRQEGRGGPDEIDPPQIVPVRLRPIPPPPPPPPPPP